MRYQLNTIGSLKRSFYQEGCRFFLDRLKPYAKIELQEFKEAKADNPVIVKTQESHALLQAASGLVVALDERGKSLTSRQLADWLTQLENQGISKLSFLIGGAEGHSEELRARAQLLWSLSPLTLPHDLARLVLLEQIYRAETIRAGHPYHRD